MELKTDDLSARMIALLGLGGTGIGHGLAVVRADNPGSFKSQRFEDRQSHAQIRRHPGQHRCRAIPGGAIDALPQYWPQVIGVND
jgi:hypothetical protein